MTIEELAGIPYRAPQAAAPEWLLGFFRRRSITFFTGDLDSDTEVYWLQTRGLSADFRLQPHRPHRDGRGSLSEFSRDELTTLVAGEGGLSRTRWEIGGMTWFDWTAFQIHDKWSEPGILHRTGDCVIEFAPSGAYVEDWRLQPTSDGPLIGLRLIEERNVETDEVTHRGGGLILCGNHAAFVRGRATQLNAVGTLSGWLRDAPVEMLRGVITSFDASYAMRVCSADPFIVSLSTNPLREGTPLLSLDGFSYDEADGLVTQDTSERGVRLKRVFTVDTLEREVSFSSATAGSVHAREWLNRESATLLAYARSASPAYATNQFSPAVSNLQEVSSGYGDHS